METAHLLGFAAGALTTISFIPQVAQAYRTRRCQDLSWAWLFIFSTGVVGWLFYGWWLQAPPIIVTNAVTLALCLSLVYAKHRFGRLDRHHGAP